MRRAQGGQAAPKKTSGAVTGLPGQWHGPSHALWTAGRQAEALQTLVNHVNGAVSRNEVPSARLYEQMGYYLFLQKSYPAALSSLQRSHQIDPDNAQNTLNLAVLYQRVGQHEQAVESAQKALAATPDNFVAYDTLCAALQRLRKFPEARLAGSTSLKLKDVHAQRTRPAPATWRLPVSRPGAGQRQLAGLRNVISFSLWGEQPRYLRGALQNLVVAPQVYPGWTLRFHVDDSVPPAFKDLLRQLGAELVEHPGTQHSTRARLCWRFAVANDPTVGYFLVRDADSVINVREAMAVDAWLAGAAHFHVIRDWWTHTDLMLAGLWGGVAGVLPPLQPLIQGYQSGVMETPNIDQHFLRDCVWSLIRHSVCVHDRLFTPPGAQSLPAPDPMGVPAPHIGQDEYAVHRAVQAQVLSGWLAQHPWL
jgi:tetratricopeptide (TPR) repeat protein